MSMKIIKFIVKIVEVLNNENVDEYNEMIREKRRCFLNKFTINLIEKAKEENSDPLIGREDILDRSIQILCRRIKNNPIHVGESGVGKTAITLGFARLISEEQGARNIKRKFYVFFRYRS